MKLIDAMLYLVKTGCQWNALGPQFPKWKTVYNHFRSWSDRGWMVCLINALACYRRLQLKRSAYPTVGVIDSESVRWGVIDSEKGFDGHKKVKGIKRHIMVDSQGIPLAVTVTKANVHDSKAVHALVAKGLATWDRLALIKADKGYTGTLESALQQLTGIEAKCVKSNFGTSEFIPVDGRWVVERTFSWLSNYRRMNRNYEKLQSVSCHMAVLACCAMLLRHL